MFASQYGKKLVVPFLQDQEKENIAFVKKGLHAKGIEYRSLKYRKPVRLRDLNHIRDGDEEFDEFETPIVIINF